MAKQKDTLVLIDGNAVFHRAYHALPPLTISNGQTVHAAYGFTMILLKVLNELYPKYIGVAFDVEGPTKRHKEYAEYKANREKKPDDLYAQVPIIKKILDAFGIPYFERPGYEADDLLASLCAKFKDKTKIIVTGDLDELQLVDDKTAVYTMRKGFTDTVVYDERAVIDRFGFGSKLLVDYKALRGDPSDNIPGVAGIGEKTASDLIKEFENIETIYQNLDKIPEKVRKKLEGHEDVAQKSKRLVTLVKDLKIDIDLKSLSFGGFDVREIADLFARLEFKSLIAKVRGLGGAAEPAAAYPHELSYGEKEAIVAAYLLNPGRRDLSIRELAFTELREDYGPAILDRLRNQLIKELREKNLFELFTKIEAPLIKVLEKMETRGVKIDSGYLSKMGERLAKTMRELEKTIYKLARAKFNINSPVQLKEILFIKLSIDPAKYGIRSKKTGLSTAAAELHKLKEAHPIIAKILEYRELAKLKSTYLDALPKLVDEKGRLHTKYNQTGTTTGRLSSSNPNLQNIPIRTDLGEEIRRAFVADQGFEFLSADYSQIELRIAAHLSGDPVMRGIFKEDLDFHASTASKILKVPIGKVDSKMRRYAKIINFGILYGMSSFGLAEATGMGRAESKQYIDDYFRVFAKLKSYLESIKTNARKTGYVETLFKRRRPIPEINSPNPILRNAAERAAINMPLQGTSADITKAAMVEIDRNWPDLKMVLQVHDELLFEIPAESVKKTGLEIKAVMENVIQLSVPVLVDLRSGTNWRDLGPVSQ